MKLKEAENTRSKIIPILETLIAFWAYGLVVWLIYTSLGYHKYTNGGITILSDDKEFAVEFSKRLGKHIKFLETDSLYQHKFKSSIYFVSDQKTTSWVLLVNRLIQSISNIIHRTDYSISAFTIGSYIIVNNNQSMDSIDSIVAHELVHALQYSRYGILHIGAYTPKWIKEGYPSYRQMEYNAINSINKPLSDEYRFYSERVDCEINLMGVTADELHEGKIKYKVISRFSCEQE